MNKSRFAEKKDYKEKTVDKWLNDGLIPGAFKDESGEWFIPNSARVPYVKARAKTKDSIFVSIVNASYQGFHVMAKLYGISDKEFDGYITQLVSAGLIIIRKEDGVLYYDKTLDSKEFLDKNNKTSYVKNFVLDAIEKVSKGITNAILEEAQK